MKKFALAFGLLLSASQLPALAVEIQASGTNPYFCSVSNTGGAINLTTNANGSALNGQGSFAFVANGDSKVSLFALTADAPANAEAFTPSVAIGSLVSNSSISTGADGAKQAGVTNVTGDITVAINENNGKDTLSAGSYAVNTVATCTAF
jgi:hypothetical protein